MSAITYGLGYNLNKFENNFGNCENIIFDFDINDTL